MFSLLNRRTLTALLIVIAAAAWMIPGSALMTFAQNAPTATPPVQTQVWIDLTATAIQVTPAAPDLNATATYQAEFAHAVATLTAQPASARATATAPNALPAVPSATPQTVEPTPEPAGQFAALEALKSTVATVNGGTFLMGTTAEEAAAAVNECALYGATCDIAWTADALPAHQVTIDSFAMETTEVSLAQYVAFLNALGPGSHLTGCSATRCAYLLNESQGSVIGFDDGVSYVLANPVYYPTYPATAVTWYGAQAYCNAIGRHLPTEAEWERAARGSEARIYPWGNQFNSSFANSSQSDHSGTQPVNTYLQGLSPYDLYHMAGNVQEWVEDWYDSGYYTRSATGTALNPQGPATGLAKVTRGGSWDTAPIFLRTMHRRSENPVTGTSAIGFRCAEDLTSTIPASTPIPTPTPGG